MPKSVSEILHPAKEDNRSGQEIADDIVNKLGLRKKNGYCI